MIANSFIIVSLKKTRLISAKSVRGVIPASTYTKEVADGRWRLSALLARTDGTSVRASLFGNSKTLFLSSVFFINWKTANGYFK